MGFPINEITETKLHYKDISLIAVALGEYQEHHKDISDNETLERARNLVNRLGSEMYNVKDAKESDYDM
jgi:hypothetical protein